MNLKPKMTYDEMQLAYLETNPIYAPNFVRVGKFAKSQGYHKVKQMVNNKISYFYVKK